MAEDESAAYNVNVHLSKPLTRSKPHDCLVQSLLQQPLLQLLQLAIKQLSSALDVKHLSRLCPHKLLPGRGLSRLCCIASTRSLHLQGMC